eukprot:gb/GECH01003009.1/.p1 GENE.gb/GECH01003009.1/~~gb/GECH01003009.1/.p1  ORF type:complete len:315 (+),score=72.97 gb/GECH01003009.1/:1-945(+)
MYFRRNGTANIKNQDDSNQNTLAFILCGPKIRLPLSKRIVVIRSEIAKYSFVLPEGKFITFTFPDETPQIILEEFEEYINQYANFKIKDETMPKRYENTFKTTESSMIEGIEYSGDTISTALINGATIIGSVIKKTGKFIQEHTRSEPEANGKIFPPFRWLVQGTRFASRSSVKVSGSLMKSVIFISSKISQSATENTVCRFLNGSDENPHLKSAKNIGKAGIVAVGNVFDAVEESTDILLNDTTDTIASGMAHRYGDDYGDITREGIGIATDMTRTYRNVRNIGRKSITHSAAKSAAKSSLQTLEQNDNSNKE